MLRNRLFAFAILGILAAGCAKTPPPQDTAADKTKLTADALSWFDRFAAADSEGIANLYAEDAIIMPPGGPAVSGRAGIKSYIGTMATQVQAGRMSLKPGTVTGSDVSDSLGWISGTYTVADSMGTTVDSGNYMSVHRRTNGTWLYVRDIWNSDRPPLAEMTHAKGAGKK
jgi:ketosteroid isomerase-like protein